MSRLLPSPHNLRRHNAGGVPEEGPAEHVANAAQVLSGRVDLAKRQNRDSFVLTVQDAKDILARLTRALKQLRDDNPPGTMLAIVNPPGRRRLMADAVYEVAYRHADDGKDYVHEFERPDDVQLLLVSDSQVLLDGGQMRIIKMFPD